MYKIVIHDVILGILFFEEQAKEIARDYGIKKEYDEILVIKYSPYLITSYSEKVIAVYNRYGEDILNYG